MAITEYVWRDVVHKDIIKCVKWCQNKLNLRDWEITVDTGDKCPKVFGKDEPNVVARAYHQKRRLYALIWVPLNRIKNRGMNAVQSTIHEMLHIACAVCGIETDEDANDDNSEDCLVFRVEAPLFKLYCLESKIKLPDELKDYWEV